MTDAKTWRAWGRLVNGELPDQSVKIGRAIVGPWPIKARPPAAPTGLKAQFPEGMPHFWTTAPAVHVESECWIVVDGINAGSYDAAVEEFVEREVPIVIAALSAGRAGLRPRFEFVGADDGQEPYVFSSVVGTAAFDPVSVPTAERLAELDARARAIASNDHLRVAAETYQRSIRNFDLTDGALSIAAAMLTAYQVLEACARIATVAPASDLIERQAEVVLRLKKMLSAKTMPAKQVAAIRDAAEALSRLELRFASLRIEYAAAEFGLGAEWIKSARALGKIRNSKLAHAGQLPTLRELSEWTVGGQPGPQGAISVASEMLSGAIDYVLNTDPR